jgi:hypothetical protein
VGGVRSIGCLDLVWHARLVHAQWTALDEPVWMSGE